MCGDVSAFQTTAGGLKTEDFSGDPGSGSSARGFIDDRVVSEGLRKLSRAGRASTWEGL